MSEFVPVRVGACLCPGTPHADGDFVYLRPKLGLAAGVILQEPVVDWLKLPASARPGQEYMRAELCERYLVLGIVEWTLMDDDGPIPVNPLTIRDQLLDDYDRSSSAADEADNLYSEVALAPLRSLVSSSSQATPTNGSTSVHPTGSSTPRKRSKRSSTTTTLTDSTEVTSAAPAGASN